MLSAAHDDRLRALAVLDELPRLEVALPGIEVPVGFGVGAASPMLATASTDTPGAYPAHGWTWPRQRVLSPGWTRRDAFVRAFSGSPAVRRRDGPAGGNAPDAELPSGPSWACKVHLLASLPPPPSGCCLVVNGQVVVPAGGQRKVSTSRDGLRFAGRLRFRGHLERLA